MVSQTLSQMSGRKARPLEMTQQQIGDAAVLELQRLGIYISPAVTHQAVKAIFTGDANFTGMTTAASIPTPLQFLQGWLPGFIKVMTAARKIDVAVGLAIVGDWKDAEIVQGIIEPLGTAREYGDQVSVPLASANTNFERRSVVRGFLGINVGTLEEERAAAMRMALAQEKRQAAGISLEQMRNAIGWNGWDAGNNRTYGLLNDPNIPAYVSVAATGTGSKTEWETKTAQQIINDIRMAAQDLRKQSGDTVDPETTPCTLLIATSKRDCLANITDIGYSVMRWIQDTYPKMRVESAPELDKASGDAAVFYLYADEIDSSIDGSTDGGATFKQLVQTKFRTLGVERRATSYLEAYSNATAGVLCARPYAVVRRKSI